MTSAYELKRESNVRRNDAELVRLGLLAPGESTKNASTKKRKAAATGGGNQQKAAARVGERRSLRCRGVDVSGKEKVDQADSKLAKQQATLSSSNSWDLHMQPWAQSFLEDKAAQFQFGSNAQKTKWNTAKTHQHLQVSASGRTVCTVGCAGYGASLVSPAVSHAHAHHWEIEVLRKGVGGFAVGLVSSKIKSPYKSLGNHPQGWMLKSTGELFHNRKVVMSCEEYSEGDIIVVVVMSGKEKKGRDAHFHKILKGSKKKELLVSLSLDCFKGAGDVMLACQPYMGGAARILRSASGH
jgi:hypothetical protein